LVGLKAEYFVFQSELKYEMKYEMSDVQNATNLAEGWYMEVDGLEQGRFG